MHGQGDRLALNVELFDQLTARRGWHTNAERAKGIGVTEATVSRARTGKSAPGTTLIAKATAALGVSTERLFPAVSPGQAFIEQIRVLVDRRPPLDEDQRAHIAMLLNPLVETNPAACLEKAVA